MKKIIEVEVKEGKKNIDGEVRQAISNAQSLHGTTIQEGMYIGVPRWAVIEKTYGLGVLVSEGNTVELWTK